MATYRDVEMVSRGMDSLGQSLLNRRMLQDRDKERQARDRMEREMMDFRKGQATTEQKRFQTTEQRLREGMQLEQQWQADTKAYRDQLLKFQQDQLANTKSAEERQRMDKIFTHINGLIELGAIPAEKMQEMVGQLPTEYRSDPRGKIMGSGIMQAPPQGGTTVRTEYPEGTAFTHGNTFQFVPKSDGMVEVREYDANGKMLKSTRMSKAEADKLEADKLEAASVARADEINQLIRSRKARGLDTRHQELELRKLELRKAQRGAGAPSASSAPSPAGKPMFRYDAQGNLIKNR